VSDTARVDQFGLEVIATENPDARIDLFGLEVIIPHDVDIAFCHMFGLEVIIPYEPEEPEPPAQTTNPWMLAG